MKTYRQKQHTHANNTNKQKHFFFVVLFGFVLFFVFCFTLSFVVRTPFLLLLESCLFLTADSLGCWRFPNIVRNLFVRLFYETVSPILFGGTNSRLFMLLFPGNRTHIVRKLFFESFLESS